MNKFYYLSMRNLQNYLRALFDFMRHISLFRNFTDPTGMLNCSKDKICSPKIRKIASHSSFVSTSIGILLFFMASGILVAAPDLNSDSIRLSTDITTKLRGNSYSDEDVVSVGKDIAGILFDAQAVGIPQGAEIDALLVYSNKIVFSTDIGFEVGSVVYANEDLVQFDFGSGQLSLLFDGSANGVKSAADLDAVAGVGNGVPDTLYLSFDITVTLPGVGVVADDDIVIFTNGVFASVIKGEDLGIPAAADIDALYLKDSTIYFSLDITADINGSIGSDSDVWKFDIGGTTVTLLGDVGVDMRADLISIDQPMDSDGDWLTDLEEYSGVDEVSSTVPGTDVPLSPRGYITFAMVSDTDGDGVSDGLESIYGTDPTDPNDFPDLSGAVMIIR